MSTILEILFFIYLAGCIPMMYFSAIVAQERFTHSKKDNALALVITTITWPILLFAVYIFGSKK